MPHTILGEFCRRLVLCGSDVGSRYIQVCVRNEKVLILAGTEVQPSALSKTQKRT